MSKMKSRLLACAALLTVAGSVFAATLMNSAGAHYRDNIDHIYSHVKDKIGLVKLTDTTEPQFDNNPTRTAFVECPEGKTPTGGGASVRATGEFYPPAEVAISRSRPYSRGWEAYASEITATKTPWKLSVYVFCADL